MNTLEPFLKPDLPSEFKDPFNKDNLDSIVITIRTRSNMFINNGKKCGAVINFTNGNTSGCQTIDDNDFEMLMLRLRDFVKTL